MKAILFVLVPVIFFSIFLSGGLGLVPIKDLPSSAAKKYNLQDNPAGVADQTLQLRALIPACTAKIAIAFLLDNSASLNDNYKLVKMKEAVMDFESKLPNDAIIGLQQFNKTASILVPFNTKTNNHASFAQKINTLTAEGNANIKDGITLARSTLDLARGNSPGYTWYLIVVTDGAPDPYPAQDPRAASQPIKVNTTVITIGIDLADDKTPGATSTLTQQILTETASDPQNSYSIASDQLKSLLSNTRTSMCTPASVGGSIGDCGDQPIGDIAHGRDEIEILAGFSPPTGGDSNLKVWYQDEHAMALGVRKVGNVTYPFSEMTKHPADHITAPNLHVGSTSMTGADAAVDDGGRPIFPSVFITDTTNNPDSRDGDWQSGGTPKPPTDVFGTWKGVNKGAKGQKGSVYTMDQNPPANGQELDGGDPPSQALTTKKQNKKGLFGAELRWDVNTLGLEKGHAYRLQFMIHDGDGGSGDPTQGCVNIIY